MNAHLIVHPPRSVKERPFNLAPLICMANLDIEENRFFCPISVIINTRHPPAMWRSSKCTFKFIWGGGLNTIRSFPLITDQSPPTSNSGQIAVIHLHVTDIWARERRGGWGWYLFDVCWTLFSYLSSQPPPKTVKINLYCSKFDF